MDIGEKLFELRKGKNLSQEEVAEKLNVTRQTVSKWETNQSTPDFDKIVPICELYGITTEELLTGNKPEEKEVVKTEDPKQEEKPLTKEEVRRKSAEVVSTSVFMYILAVVFIMLTIVVLGIDPIISSSIFLLIIGWATARIVKHYMSVPKFEETKAEKREKQVVKEITNIVWMICTCFYFFVSFTTMAWHISWIIFVIGAAAESIVKLVFLLKEGDDDEE